MTIVSGLTPCVVCTGAVQNSDGRSAGDELGPRVGKLGTTAGHVRPVLDHHVGRVPFLPTRPAHSGRRTADLLVELETPKSVVLQLERGQQAETRAKVAGATDSVPGPASPSDKLPRGTGARQQTGE